jgi:hypothetical protein
VAYKGSALDEFVAHLSKRLKVKEMPLDGWLGNNYYAKHTITMNWRIAEYMKEHLPEEMKSKPPPTPYHPELMNLRSTSVDNGRYSTSRAVHLEVVKALL